MGSNDQVYLIHSLLHVHSIVHMTACNKNSYQVYCGGVESRFLNSHRIWFRLRLRIIGAILMLLKARHVQNRLTRVPTNKSADIRSLLSNENARYFTIRSSRRLLAYAQLLQLICLPMDAAAISIMLTLIVSRLNLEVKPTMFLYNQETEYDLSLQLCKSFVVD